VRKRNWLVITIILLLSGCSLAKADMQGIVLEVKKQEVILAKNLSQEAYEEIENESVTSLQNQMVDGTVELELFVLTYENLEEIDVGDEVAVYLDGDIMSSYPAQAKAKKIKVKNKKMEEK